MDKPDDVVGHKTFATGDPLNPFRHEPLTRQEADAVWERVEAAKAKRAADMPTEQDAVNTLWRAWYRLKELGWEEARYAHSLKKDGIKCRLIELGSSGIHVGYYHGVNDRDVWWVGGEGYSSHPCLVKTLAAIDSSANSKEKP